MSNIELKNVFLANLRFASSYSNEIVIAKDETEAILAINDFYADPQITAISCLEEMLEIMDKFKNKKDLVMIEELCVENDGSLTVKVSDDFGSIMDLKNKYDEKKAVLLDEEKALFIVLNNLYFIKNSNNFPIVGKTYLK